MKTKIREQTLWLFALLGAILCMGVGYASINSITGEITGNLVAKVQEGVFITNVEYISDVDANLDTSKINKYVGTLMQSTVELSKTNPNSEITYRVTVYNNSANSYPFLSVNYDYDEEFYDNLDITFEISGFVVGDIIGAKEKKEILITFKYNDGVIPTNTVLNSYINFKIAEPRRLVLAQNVDSTGTYLRGTITKDKIESIDFVISKEPPTNIIESFDASEKEGDKNIIGYYTNSYTDGLYKLTFVSDEIMAANKNAQYLFKNLTNLKEISLNNLSTFGVTNMEAMFSRCTALATLDVSRFDTSKVGNMSGMFQECKTLAELDLSSFNTSQLNGINNMFNGCSGLTKLNVSNFNTSKITDMFQVFMNCWKLIELDVSKWDTRQVTTMYGMFYGCSSLTGLNVNEWDTGKVEIMYAVFSKCIGLTQLDLSNWNTSSVTQIHWMFGNCSSLTNLDVSGFDTSKVFDMSSMFEGCSKLTELNLTNFNTSNVKNITRMFLGCTSLEKLDLSGFNVSLVTNMSFMFYKCYALRTLDLSGFNTSKVTDMTYMFNNCWCLKTVYVREFNTVTQTGWTTSLVTTSGVMFTGCTSLTGGNGTTITGNPTDATYARIDKGGTPGYFTKKTEPVKILLAENTPATGNYLGGPVAKNQIKKITFQEGKEKPQGIAYEFTASEPGDGIITGYYTNSDTEGLYELTFVSDGIMTANENSQYLFQNLTSLTEINFGNFNTIGTTKMNNMFSGCSELTALDLSKFNTSQVTTMSSMFDGCSKLGALDLSGFNTKLVDNMNYMFYGCGKLTKIYVTPLKGQKGWSTAAVTSSTNMFLGATSLSGGNGTVYNSNNIDATFAVVDSKKAKGYLTDVAAKP